MEILFAVYPGLALLDVVGPAEVFATANQVLGRELYRSRVGAVTGSALVAGESGLELAVAVDLRRARTPDTLIVAGGNGYREASADAAFLGAVRRLAPRTRRLASVCTGAFVLAELGLLDGLRATTHWAYARELAERYPAVAVEPDAIFVREGRVTPRPGSPRASISRLRSSPTTAAPRSRARSPAASSSSFSVRAGSRSSAGASSRPLSTTSPCVASST